MSAPLVDEALIRPIEADRPCGEDLEDTPLLASFDAFRVFGLRTPYDPVPEWSTIAGRAAEALCRSKDLRLLAYLGTALLRTDGLAPFTETLGIASQWLETFWKDVYPRIDEDAILRRNALNCFADQMAVIDGLRRLPLVESRQHGSFSLRDVEIATGIVAGDGDTPPADEARINAAFATVSRGAITQLQDTVARTQSTLLRIAAKMREDGGPDAAPGFDPLEAQLTKIDRVLRAQLALRGDDVAEGDGEGGPADASAGPSISGVVKSRQDAIRALDAVAAFFRQHEPSSPVPMIVDRAKRLVAAKDFFEVLADIAPDAVGQARSAGGLRD